MDSPTWYAIATLLAIISGPLLAVGVTRFIDHRTEKKRRQINVFTNLMQTRGIRIDPLHVATLNIVEIEFHKNANVRAVFAKYISHLSDSMPAVSEQDKFFARRSDLFMDLLYEIGKAVGLNFDKRDLERLAYVPEGWNIDQTLQRRNAQFLNQLLSGERPLPITNFLSSTSPYPNPPTIEE